MKGTFIVFEGIDGSGKGTVIGEAKKFLVSKGVPEKNILVTAEPTPGFYGKKVRELLASNVNPDVNAHHFLDLYVADRKEHIEKELKPALASGKIVLCDRYKYSTFVYQKLQGIPIEKIISLHKGMLVPDLIFILDVPVDAALKRINADSKRKNLEAFEKKDFLEKVRGGFTALKRFFPEENIVVVDASKGIESVSGAVCRHLAKII